MHGVQELDKDIWVVSRPFHYFGVDFGSRMTVIRLSDGGLFLHSPVRLTAETHAWLETLGPVRFVVAPSNMHYVFLSAYEKAFPNARIFIAPGVEKKLPDLHFHGILGTEPEADWADVIDQVLLQGTRPQYKEIVFVHKPTRTLIVTDLVFNLVEAHTLWEKAFQHINKLGRGMGPSRLFRLAIADKKAARRSIDKILAWEPERVIMAHGEIYPKAAKRAVERAFAWL